MSKTIAKALGLATLCVALFASASPAQGAQSHPYLFAITKFVPAPNAIERFEGPCGLAVDTSGDLYVSDYYHDKVDVFTSGGALLTQLPAVEPLDGPCGLALDGAGNLFVNAFHRNLMRFTPAAFPIAAKTAYGPGAPIDEAHPTGLAYDPGTGHLYVDERSQVAVYQPSGAPFEEGGAPLTIGEGSLGEGYGVAVSEFPATAGYVYVADAADDTVKVFDPATSLQAPIQTIGGVGTPQGGFPTLRDAALAIDSSTGHLFVAYNAQGPFYEHPKAAVAEFNAAGEYRGTLPAPSALWFGEPSGIAVDASATATAGRVYLTTGNSQFETAGSGEERKEESAVYAFGPSAPGQRLEASLTGAGEGAVTSSPAGISCPGACAAEYDEGTQVTLSASAAPGSAFAGWSGCDSEPGGACRVAMSAAKAVAAEFALAPAAGAIGAGPGAVAAQGAAAAPSALSVPAAAPTSAVGDAALRRAQRRRAQRNAQAKARRARHRHRLGHRRDHGRKR